MNYESTTVFDSKALPGVRVRLRRISFGARLELARLLRDALERIDRAMSAPPGEARDAQAAGLAAEADMICLRWAVCGIEGLEIDGQAATVESLIERGPEPLVVETIERVRAECGLNEQERKNSESHSTSCEAGRPGLASDGSATPAVNSDCSTAATAD